MKLWAIFKIEVLKSGKISVVENDFLQPTGGHQPSACLSLLLQSYAIIGLIVNLVQTTSAMMSVDYKIYNSAAQTKSLVTAAKQTSRFAE